MPPVTIHPLQALIMPPHRRPRAGESVLALCPDCGISGELFEVAKRNHQCETLQSGQKVGSNVQPHQNSTNQFDQEVR